MRWSYDVNRSTAWGFCTKRFASGRFICQWKITTIDGWFPCRLSWALVIFQRCSSECSSLGLRIRPVKQEPIFQCVGGALMSEGHLMVEILFCDWHLHRSLLNLWTVKWVTSWAKSVAADRSYNGRSILTTLYIWCWITSYLWLNWRWFIDMDHR